MHTGKFEDSDRCDHGPRLIKSGSRIDAMMKPTGAIDMMQGYTSHGQAKARGFTRPVGVSFPTRVKSLRNRMAGR